MGIAAGLIGVALLVLGTLGFARASDRHDAASRADTQRRSSQAVERRAVDARSAITQALTALRDNVLNVTKASDDLRKAQNALTDAFNHAIDLANGGDTGGAQAAFAAQSAAIAALDAKLAAAQQALLQSEQRLDQLRMAEHG